MSLKEAVKRIWFGLRGVEAEPVVVVFRTGPADLCDAMAAEARRLLPGLRHFEASPDEGYWRLRRRFARLRIGMAPVLLDGDPAFRRARWRAFQLAPRKLLAYDRRLDRHHLKLSQPLASLLFFLGAPLDRIWIRPRWWPFRKERSSETGTFRVLAGRPLSATRQPVSLLTPYFPWPLSHGGAVRIFNLLRESSIEFDIVLFAFVESERPEDFEALLPYCAKLILVPKPRYREPRWSTLAPPEVGEYVSATMRGLLREHRSGPLQVEYTQLASYPGDVLVEHDVTYDLYRQIHERRPSALSWWNLFRWRRFEMASLRRYPRVVAMSEKDAVLCAGASVQTIPNGVDLERFQPRAETPGRRLLFIGSFRHFPNIAAFRFLTGEVLPLLSGVELTVVAGPDPQLHWSAFTGERAWPSIAGVTVLGFLADVRPLYEAANIAVAPTLESAGTNLKVLEAMAAGRAIVSTPTGCAGLGLEHGDGIRVAASPREFAAEVRRLLEDARLRAETAVRARAIVEQRFSWTSLARIQRELWREFAPAVLCIRSGAAGDRAAIAAILGESAGAGQWMPDDCLVAELGGHAIALLAVRETAPGEHEILNVAVRAAQRRQGVARRLLEHWLEGVRGEVFLEVRESNEAARTLYEALGFAVVGIRGEYYDSPVENGIVMRLRKC